MIPVNAAKPMDGRKGRTGFLLDIQKKRDRLSAMRPLTPGEVERLRKEFMVEFTYNSNAIEGNTLTLKETAMVLEAMTIDQKPLKDHLEAIGHVQAFEYIQTIAETDCALNETIIKNIHSLVLIDRREDRGIYRRIPVKIMGAYTEPVQPYMIEPKMTELIEANKERNQTLHVIERIARFHLEFEGIHPFIDGNGRTGRLILNLDLIRNGFPPINVKFTDRKRYYDAFDAFYRDDDAGAMIDLIAEYVDERLDEYLNVLGE
jgi:Fic family protein